MKLDQLKLLTDIASPWISAVAVVAGGLFASFQYLEKVDADRVKETLGFLDRYSKSPFVTSKVSILEAWERKSPERESRLEKEPFDSVEFNQWILVSIQESGIGADVIMLVDFFDSLESCIQRRICDAPSATQFFQEDARALYHLHFAKIEHERAQRKGTAFAASLLEFCRRPARP